jgi:hypothetical protein
MLIFFVMLVVLLQTVRGRQFWAVPPGGDAQVYLIPCPKPQQRPARFLWRSAGAFFPESPPANALQNELQSADNRVTTANG